MLWGGGEAKASKCCDVDFFCSAVPTLFFASIHWMDWVVVGRVVDLTFDCIAFCLLRLRFFFFRLVYICRAQQKYRGVFAQARKCRHCSLAFQATKRKKTFCWVGQAKASVAVSALAVRAR